MAMETLRIAAKESKFLKFVLGGFIFLAVGGLVFTDVGGYFTGGINNTTVAKINDTKIDLRQFDADIQNMLRQTGLSKEQAYNAGIINMVLEQKIQEILKANAANDLDLKLDNEAIAKKLKTLFGNGTKEQIEMSLRAQGISEQQLADRIEFQTITETINTLPSAVTNYVPEFKKDALNALNKEQRNGTIYTISLSNLADKINVSEDEISAYYMQNAEEFTIPEERQFIIGKMTINDIKKSTPKITAQDIKDAYNNNINDFTIPEKRFIAQAFTKDVDEAQSIYEAALNGTPLDKAFKDVTGSDKGYNKAVSFEQKGLPAPLSEKAFNKNVKKGDIIAPVKTLIGYTVMQITDIKQSSVKPFNNVKNDIKKDLEQSAIDDALYNKMIDSEDMIDNGQNFDDIATATNLKTSKTKFFTIDDLTTNAKNDLKTVLENTPSLRDELFTLRQGGATYPLEINEETYIIIGVSNIKQKSMVDFEDVKKDIVKTIKQNKKQTLATEKLATLVNGLNDQSIAPKSLKSDYKATAKSFKNLKRDADTPNKSIVYSTNMTDQYAYRIDDKNAYIAYVSDINYNNKKAKDAEDLEAQQDAIINALLNKYYRENANISINDYLLAQFYGQKSTN